MMIPDIYVKCESCDGLEFERKMFMLLDKHNYDKKPRQMEVVQERHIYSCRKCGKELTQIRRDV